MKKFLFTITIVLTFSLLYPQSINVTRPNERDVFITSISRNLPVEWNSTGISGQVRVILRKADRSVRFVLTRTHAYNNTPFTFSIPPEASPGDYEVIVAHPDATDSSARFKIQSSIATRTIAYDFEMVGIHISAVDNFLYASMKNNQNNFSGDLLFHILLPEASRSGVVRVTKPISLNPGRTLLVRLYEAEKLMSTGIETLVRVKANANNRILETNPDNNIFEKKLTHPLVDLQTACSRQAGDFLRVMVVQPKPILQQIRVSIRVRVRAIASARISSSLTDVEYRYRYMVKQSGRWRLYLDWKYDTIPSLTCGNIYHPIAVTENIWKHDGEDRVMRLEFELDPENKFRDINPSNNVNGMTFGLTAD
jgi:hypothetical protein